MALLICKDVQKTYKVGDVEVPALRGVDLTMERGSFTMITGSSGSGKSTLLHCIAGIDKPDSGEILIDGTDIHTLSEKESAVFRRRNIGLVYQSFHLLPTLSAEQNILLPLSLDGKECDKDYFDALINTLGIREQLTHYPAQMSGGEQQRCAIARALIAKPLLCLADEPTGNLDRRNTDEIMKLLRKMQSEFGQTIVMVTHDMRLTEEGERVVTFEDGRIIGDTKGSAV